MGDAGSSLSSSICPPREGFQAKMGTHLSTSIQRNKPQFRTADLHAPDRVRQQLTIDPLQLLEILTMSRIGCIVDMRDLLDAGHMLQLQERFLAIKQVDAGI
jgi:hypothetical protein